MDFADLVHTNSRGGEESKATGMTVADLKE